MSKDYFTDEGALLRELSKGNNEAFEFLFNSYYPRLQNYAHRFISDIDVVKDIIQDCFVKLWEKQEVIKIVSIQTFLFVMVRNSCINYLKHRAVVDKYHIEYLAKIKGEEKLYHADFLCDTEYPLLYDELNNIIQDTISTLSERCREVFLMSRFEGLKNKEIAEKLKISTTAVEKHIAKAIKIFEVQLRNKSLPGEYIIIILSWLIGDYL